MIAAAEHFVAPPHWEWYIVGYFFLAGIAGGSYLLGTMLRLFGRPDDEPAARLAFLISLPALVVCPVLLTVDLGRPARFWHMLVDTSPGGRLVFKYWTPMSLGVWGLMIFGVFALVAFLDALVGERRLRWSLTDRIFGGLRGRASVVVNVVGSVLALFVASYTGVLLSVSDQPVWSDTWALGGLFLASGLSGSAALVLLLARLRPSAAPSVDALARADAYFVVLEVLLIAALLATVASAGAFTQLVGGKWIILWVAVGMTIIVGLSAHARVAVIRRLSPLITTALVLAGVLVLRAVVIFSAQS